MAGDLNIDTAGIGSIVTGIGTLAKDIRAAITGKAVLDPAAQAALEQKLAELEQSGMNAQAEINKVEAASPKLFVSGWRPFLGWVCGAGCAYSWIVLPFASWVARVCFHYSLDFPVLDIGPLVTMTIGMLGLAGYRTYEKKAGVASK
jgi:hypothetical protein